MHKTVRVKDVTVPPRWREGLGDFDALVHSIADVGLLHPIVIDSKNRLLAGYRRLEAYKKLGLTKIEATVVEIDDGDEAEH